MQTHRSHKQISVFVILLATVSPALPIEPDATVLPQARAVMLSMPRPQYPEEALRKHITGSGRCELLFNLDTGRVTRVTVEVSLERFLFLFYSPVFPVVHTPIRARRATATAPFDQCDHIGRGTKRRAAKSNASL